MGCRSERSHPPLPPRDLSPRSNYSVTAGLWLKYAWVTHCLVLAYLGLGIHVGARSEEIVDTVTMGAGSRHHEGREAHLCTRRGGWRVGTTRACAQP